MSNKSSRATSAHGSKENTTGNQPPKGGSFSRPANRQVSRPQRQLNALARCVADLCRNTGQLEWIDLLEEEGLIEHGPEERADLATGDMEGY